MHGSDPAFRIRLNSGLANRIIFPTSDRQIFRDGQLIGYRDKGTLFLQPLDFLRSQLIACTEAFGTFIHPSAYLVYDIDIPIPVNARGWSFHLDFLAFRERVVWNEEQMFWEQATDEIDGRLKAVRILVCGNAGIGKSTLINKVFDLPMVRDSNLSASREVLLMSSSQ